MYETVVAIDLETTGPDAYKDHIIEVGAVLYVDGAEADRFSELVKSPVPLTPSIIKLTGIQPSMLEEARPVEAVLGDFLEWLPKDALCIAHNAAFERAFLRRMTRDAFRHVVLDTVELSRICFPQLASHSLSALAEVLDLSPSDAHRAIADCNTLLRLWEKILTRAVTIPLPVLREMNQLLEGRKDHPYRDFFRRLEEEVLTRRFGQDADTLPGVYGRGQPIPEPRQYAEDDDCRQALDPEYIPKVFGEDGLFAKKLEGYELRHGQVEMAEAMVDAINHEKHILVEAGTGTGKSLGYLVPAVMMATKNNTPVVISTNTKNLQAQLFEKDLPFLRDVLGVEFKSAIIKGRGNYLCLRKLMYLLRNAGVELDADDRMRLLNVLPWSAWTESGDISENIVAGRPGFYGVWSKLSTIGDECMGKACKQCKVCFLRRARAKTLNADIVIANHSLVFAEMNIKSPALPPYQHLIFDEAHNLEDAATNHLSVEIALPRFNFALGRLYRTGRRKKGVGLLPSLQGQVLAAKAIVAEVRKQCDDFVEQGIDAIRMMEKELKTFFGVLDRMRTHKGEMDSVRFQSDRKWPATWDAVEDSRKSMTAALAAVIHAVTGLRDILKEMKSSDLPYLRETIRDLDAMLQWLRELSDDVAFVLDASQTEYVYWAERMPPKQGSTRLMAAPIKVGALLYDQVYMRKRTVAFVSATLSVRDSFDFVKGRLGIDALESDQLIEVHAGTPFDYEEQCRVLVPTFLPEPGERGRDYAGDLAVLLSEVFRRTQGRGLGLFTSYDMLQKTGKVLQKEMLGDGIQILSQGLSGSRESMTATFKRDIHSVLLGTHSFWEGVDVVGEALSCLVIARLPFQVFTDPVVEARREQVESDGDNAFMGYSLPNAVIRFRQGFGRLIRHKTDRGVVIVADRRMVAKRYGKWFQDSLPAATETFACRETFLAALEELFAR